MRHVAAALAAACLLALAPPAEPAVVEGDLAPDFRGTDLSGLSHTLYQYRGKVVVLYVLGST